MILKIMITALLAGLASILANQGIAIFNDGLRPLVPEFLEGRMNKKTFFTTSFALSFGLVIGFGIPFSIGKNIILIHSIFLGTDIIGSFFYSDKKGLIFSFIIGSAYGIGLITGLQFIVDLFGYLPINFLPNLQEIGRPVIVSFSVFPILVIGYQYGIKKGLFSLIVVLLFRQIITIFGKINLGELNININADGIALLIGVILMLYFALTEKYEKNNSNEMLLGIFSERIKKLKKNILLLSLMGGLVSTAVYFNIVSGDPISLNLMSDGQRLDAALVSLARTIGFIPLVATTAITTGVYGPTGLTFVFCLGLFSPNPIIAFILGFLSLFLEILMLEKIAKLLDRFPGIKYCGDQIRTAITKVLEISLLIGSMIACNNMSNNSGLGYLFIISVFLLNKSAKKPLVDMAVGPIATILFGILLNVLYLFKLFIPAV